MLTAAVVVAAAAIALDRSGLVPVLGQRCTASTAGGEETRPVDQMANAATIAAVGLREGLGEESVTIALATAIQESKLRNLPDGDRDSIGLFQQRPSQGWGTPEQVGDPVYAATKFYETLVEVPSYRELPLTEAAQAVQRSAFPDAYADHEAEAAVLSAALTGQPGADLTCSLRPDSVPAQVEGPDGLTPRAAEVRAVVERAFGAQSLGGFAPGGVDSGHVEGSAHYDGRALDIFFRPSNDENRRAGWAMAHFLVAHADELDVATVIYDGRIWTTRRSGQGWRDYRPSGGQTDDPVLMHRDHVHVDVREGS